jgi:2-iminobutanoate/2-iminopropanoate deaminase
MEAALLISGFVAMGFFIQMAYSANPKEVITSSDAPQAIGPYSQAIKTNDLLFVSGQIPIDPKSGNVVAGSIEAQTRQVLNNLQALIEAGGMSLQDVVKTSCFLKNMDDFGRFNEVYSTFFKDKPPARETVEVARLPRDVLVEISCICSK